MITYITSAVRRGLRRAVTVARASATTARNGTAPLRTTRRALRRAIKSMTITGYYTTEIGLRQELGDDGRMMLGTFEGARIRNINRGMLQCWFLIADPSTSLRVSPEPCRGAEC